MKLYDELADLWPLMSPSEDYAAEAGPVAGLLSVNATMDRRRLLELGAGGGHLASHLKARFDMTLVDLSPRMLENSRRLNTERRHLTGDMRRLRLDERFDAVLVFDAISHMTTEADLLATMRTARAHLEPADVALCCPDWTVKCFAPATPMGGIDGPERGMRYLEWTQPTILETAYESDLVYLLREADGTRRVVHDRMVLCIFPRATWTRLVTEAGFGQVAVAEQSGRDVIQARAGLDWGEDLLILHELDCPHAPHYRVFRPLQVEPRLHALQPRDLDAQRRAQPPLPGAAATDRARAARRQTGD